MKKSKVFTGKRKFPLPAIAQLSLLLFSAHSWGMASAPSPADGQERWAQQCADLAALSLPSYDLDIKSASYITDASQLTTRDLPEADKAAFKPFCKIEGYFERRAGVNNKQYAIGFGISLPENWNGRYLFQGGGALNGLIREPLGNRATGDTPALFRGYAVVSTDSGHQSDAIFNHDFFEDQKALLNFYSQAIYKTTLLTKKIVTDFYGDAPQHTYFVGCSTGGREAMTMSQRYPELFDGIIAGAPAMRTNYSEIADLWSARSLRSISKDGKSSPFSAPQQQRIVDSLLKQCDARDGLDDGLIMDPSGCDFDPAELQCPAGKQGDSCLSEIQVNALKRAFGGPKLASGENIYPGFFYDTGIAATGEHGVPGLLQGVAGPLGKPRMDEPFDMQRELAIAQDFPLAPGNATLTNLSTFAAVGGKLMFFHGVSDPWFSAKDTFQYFNDMAEKNGGLKEVQDWAQFYFVPGMGHCQGGEKALDNFDMLTALEAWVEQDKQPASVPATSTAYPELKRPLCPHPSVSSYRGKGDTNNVESFECHVPASSKQ